MDAALPGTRAFEKAMLCLHKAQTVRQLGNAVVDLMYELLPMQAAAAYLYPTGFKELMIFARPDYLDLFQQWVQLATKKDIWLRRSPPTPGQRLVRHTDHTPDSVFARSEMCRIMAGRNLRYGAALQVWDGCQLSALVVMNRSKLQGDFSDAEMRLLGRIFPFIDAAVSRVFALHAGRLSHLSMAQVSESANEGIVLLDSDQEILHYNSAAVRLCAEWLDYNPRLLKQPYELQLPPEVLKTCKTWITAKSSVKSRKAEVLIKHKTKAIRCTVQHIEDKAAASSRGNFLMQFSTCESPSNTDRVVGINKLTASEREVVIRVCAGKTNPQVACELKKSLGTVRNQLHGVFQKLEITRRSQLVAWWVGQNSRKKN